MYNLCYPNVKRFLNVRYDSTSDFVTGLCYYQLNLPTFRPLYILSSYNYYAEDDQGG
jgi:hypothetical protein